MLRRKGEGHCELFSTVEAPSPRRQCYKTISPALAACSQQNLNVTKVGKSFNVSISLFRGTDDGKQKALNWAKANRKEKQGYRFAAFWQQCVNIQISDFPILSSIFFQIKFIWILNMIFSSSNLICNIAMYSTNDLHKCDLHYFLYLQPTFLPTWNSGLYTWVSKILLCKKSLWASFGPGHHCNSKGWMTWGR